MTSASAPTGVPERGAATLEGGRYRLGRLLARSPGSEVYRGHDSRLDRPVVIKLARDAAGERLVAREAEVLARLSHQRVVRLLDVGRCEDTTALILEHAGDANLEAVVRAHGPAPLPRALAWACDALEALAHLHSRGLAHLDVKPSNLVLTDDGRVTLIDLGLARPLDDGSRIEAGTARYRDGAGPRTAVAHDLYAVGMTLRTLLGPQTAPERARLIDRLCAAGSDVHGTAAAARADLERHARETARPPEA